MEGQRPDLESLNLHKFVKYIMRRNMPRGIFHLYDNAYFYGGISHKGSTSARYHAALDELDLMGDILAGVHGLGKQGMRDLARQLKKATK